MLSFARRVVTAVTRYFPTSVHQLARYSVTYASSIEPAWDDLPAVPGQWPISPTSTPAQPKDLPPAPPTLTSPVKEDTAALSPPPPAPVASDNGEQAAIKEAIILVDTEPLDLPVNAEPADLPLNMSAGLKARLANKERPSKVFIPIANDLVAPTSTNTTISEAIRREELFFRVTGLTPLPEEPVVCRTITHTFSPEVIAEVHEERALRAKLKQGAAAQKKKAAEVEQEAAKQKQRQEEQERAAERERKDAEWHRRLNAHLKILADRCERSAARGLRTSRPTFTSLLRSEVQDAFLRMRQQESKKQEEARQKALRAKEREVEKKAREAEMAKVEEDRRQVHPEALGSAPKTPILPVLPKRQPSISAAKQSTSNKPAATEPLAKKEKDPRPAAEAVEAAKDAPLVQEAAAGSTADTSKAKKTGRKERRKNQRNGKKRKAKKDTATVAVPKKRSKEAPRKISQVAIAQAVERKEPQPAIVGPTDSEKTALAPAVTDLLSRCESLLRKLESFQFAGWRETCPSFDEKDSSSEEDCAKSEPQHLTDGEILFEKYESFRFAGWRETEVFSDDEDSIGEDDYTNSEPQPSAGGDSLVPAITNVVSPPQSSDIRLMSSDELADVFLPQAFAKLSLGVINESARVNAPQAANENVTNPQVTAAAQIVSSPVAKIGSSAADEDDNFSDLSSDCEFLDEDQAARMLASVDPSRILTPTIHTEVDGRQQPRVSSAAANEERKDGGARKNEPEVDDMEYDPTRPFEALQPPVLGPGNSASNTHMHRVPASAAPAPFLPRQDYQQPLRRDDLVPQDSDMCDNPPMFHPLTFDIGDIASPSRAQGINGPPIRPPTNEMEVDHVPMVEPSPETEMEDPPLAALYKSLFGHLQPNAGSQANALPPQSLNGHMDGLERQFTQLDEDVPMGSDEHHLIKQPPDASADDERMDEAPGPFMQWLGQPNPAPANENMPIPTIEMSESSTPDQDQPGLLSKPIPLRLPCRADVVAFVPGGGIHIDELWQYYGNELMTSQAFQYSLGIFGVFDENGWYFIQQMPWQLEDFPTVAEFLDAVPRTGIQPGLLNERFTVDPSRLDEYFIGLFYCWGHIDQNGCYFLNEDEYGNNFPMFGHVPLNGSQSGPDSGSQHVPQSDIHHVPEQARHAPSESEVQPVPVVDESNRYHQQAGDLHPETAVAMVTDPPRPPPSSFFPSNAEVLMAIPLDGSTVVELWAVFGTTRVPKDHFAEFRYIVMEVTVPKKPKSPLRVPRHDLMGLMLEWRENRRNFPTGQLPPAGEPYQRWSMCWNPACPRQDQHYCLKPGEVAEPTPLAGVQTATPGDVAHASVPTSYDSASPAGASSGSSNLPGLGNCNLQSFQIDIPTTKIILDQPRIDFGTNVDFVAGNYPEQFRTSFFRDNSNGPPQSSTSAMPLSSSHGFTYGTTSLLPPCSNPPTTTPTIGMIDGDSSDDEEPTRPFPTVEELKDFVGLEGVDEVATISERFRHRIGPGQEQQFKDLVDQHTFYDHERLQVRLRAPRLPTEAELLRHLPIGRGALMDIYEEYLPKCNPEHHNRLLEIVNHVATWDSGTLKYHAKVQSTPAKAQKSTSYPMADEIFYEIPVPNGISFRDLKAKFEGRLDSQPTSRFNELVGNVSFMNHSKILKRKPHYFATSEAPVPIAGPSAGPAPASQPSSSRAHSPEWTSFPTQDEVFYAIPADAGIKFKNLAAKFEDRIAGDDFRFLKLTKAVSTRHGFSYRRRLDYSPASIPSWCLNQECEAKDLCDCPEPRDGEA